MKGRFLGPKYFCLKVKLFIIFFCFMAKISRVMITRYLEEEIRKDLEEKMVFLSGPRQVGKTTLAKTVRKSEGGGLPNDL
jgi:predicted AAA+ superfamily ATPase